MDIKGFRREIKSLGMTVSDLQRELTIKTSSLKRPTSIHKLYNVLNSKSELYDHEIEILVRMGISKTVF
jgi:hypothetical protein